MINKEYTDLLAIMFEGVYVVDVNRKIIFWNTGSEKITGYSSAEVLNKNCHDNILQHVDKNGKELCFGGCPLHHTLQTGEEVNNDVFLHHKDGHRIPIAVRSYPLRDPSGKITAAVEVFTDNRMRKNVYRENKRLQELLITDELTQISNRRYLDFQLKNILIESIEFEQSFGLLFIDIDYFKDVNDKYGHLIGDEVLKLVSNTINSNIRGSDIFGRWGGEEFLLIGKIQSTEEMALVAEKLRIMVEKSFIEDENGNKISVTISLGGALYSKGDSIEKLVELADENMYAAKKAGRNKFTV